MPCRVFTDQEEAEMARNRFEEVQKELDFVTKHLCKMIKDLEGLVAMENWMQKEDPELYDWWQYHKERDKARIIHTALNKLTPEEIETLKLTEDYINETLLD